MRGHVHKRGKTWPYVVDVGRDPATGQRRQRTKGGCRTRRAAEDALAAAMSSAKDGTYIAQDPQTVSSGARFAARKSGRFIRVRRQ
ncbi:MAG: Arm DNA-binding domain-containing protein [Acidimicrobiia bacterium]